jgi:hypothetical protein
MSASSNPGAPAPFENDGSNNSLQPTSLAASSMDGLIVQAATRSHHV